MDICIVKGHLEQGMARRIADRDILRENDALRAKLAETEALLAMLMASRERRREQVVRRIDAIRAENQTVGILRRIWGAMVVREV